MILTDLAALLILPHGRGRVVMLAVIMLLVKLAVPFTLMVTF
jgi:hypothetical protein